MVHDSKQDKKVVRVDEEGRFIIEDGIPMMVTQNGKKIPLTHKTQSDFFGNKKEARNLQGGGNNWNEMLANF
jgi:hypothetical protein